MVQGAQTPASAVARAATGRRLALIKAHTSLLPAKVVFRGNTWRGRIGDEFTVNNVRKVTRAITQAMGEDVFFKTTWCRSFVDVQYGGILVLDDAKPLSIAFAEAAIQEVVGAQIYLHRTDACPSESVPALLRRLWAVGALTMTQTGEHAEMRVHTAGGHASTDDFFAAIQQHANGLMEPRRPFEPYEPTLDVIGERTHFFHLDDVFPPRSS